MFSGKIPIFDFIFRHKVTLKDRITKNGSLSQSASLWDMQVAKSQTNKKTVLKLDVIRYFDLPHSKLEIVVS